MANTETSQDLLTACIQDLYAGERDIAARVPAVAAQARDHALRTALGRIVAQAQSHVGKLEGSERAKGGPENIWITGILDDAERDTRTITPGPLLDIAMIGAVRKALAAKRVSYETAIAVAIVLTEQDLATTLEHLCAAETAADNRLGELLGAIVPSAGPTQ